MKKIKFFTFLLIVIIIVSQAPIALASQVNVKAYINGQDIDKAANRASAITINNSTVNFSWKATNNTSKPIQLTTVSATYSMFLSKDFDASETIKPGETASNSVNVQVPSWILKLKGVYNVELDLNSTNGVVAHKSIWVNLGFGNPLTGVIGGTGAALGVAALGFGAASAAQGAKTPKIPDSGQSPADADLPKSKKKRGAASRRISSAAMALAVFFIMMSLGINFFNPLTSFLTGAAFAGLGQNVIVRLLTKAFSLSK